jgi:hypothetical protein
MIRGMTGCELGKIVRDQLAMNMINFYANELVLTE